jgi:hypothetical protein
MPQLIAVAKDYLPESIGQSPGLQTVIYGVVLVAFVLFEPHGLYGRWLKMRTYLQLFPFYRRHVQAAEGVPEVGPAQMTHPLRPSAAPSRGQARACKARWQTGTAGSAAAAGMGRARH